MVIRERRNVLRELCVGRLLHSGTGFDCIQRSTAFCSEERKKGRKQAAFVKLVYFSSQPLPREEVTTLVFDCNALSGAAFEQ